MRSALTFTCLILAATAIGCQTPVETTPVTGKMKAADLPNFAVGSQWLGLRNDKNVEVTLIDAKGDDRSFQGSWGCSWTKSANPFAPTTKFANCSGNTGTQTITKVEGSLWPLEVGKTQNWSLTGSNQSGDNWRTTRRCKVESAERVAVGTGQYDTFKVVCQDSWRTRTWFYAPEVQSVVLSTNYHRQKNEMRRWELIKGPGGPY